MVVHGDQRGMYKDAKAPSEGHPQEVRGSEKETGEKGSKGGGRPATQGTFGSKVSFKDKVVGVSTPKPLVIDESLEGIVLPWLREAMWEGLKLRFIWRLKGGYEILDVGNDYFLVKCDLLEDREKVHLGGSWMILSFYLVVKPWSFEFHPTEESFGSTLMWVCFKWLKILYYQEKAMQCIATEVGKPIKVDVATKEVERGKFARACILIDLGVLVIDEIEVDDVIYKVDYEHLELICEKCRCYGHVVVYCKKDNDVKAVEEDFSLPENDNQHADSAKMQQRQDASVFGKSLIKEGNKGYPKSMPSKMLAKLGDVHATNQEEEIGAWIKVDKNREGSKRCGQES
ncbi:hypothetical protein Ahy_A03g012941 [Arachis hypogaea]|uniref:DUF4283 domain-containing protein n=1 Tax=Arachis hypogaea TaxID=3818 RepID=A0A445DUI2_ARAHY|nr:hypothetical protein Ahy_A03g012941 [Arachis hypogaea]